MKFIDEGKGSYVRVREHAEALRRIDTLAQQPAAKQDGDALIDVVIALKRACDEGLIVNPPGLNSDAVGVLSDAANDALTAKAAAPAPGVGEAVRLLDEWMDGYDHVGTSDSRRAESASRKRWAEDRSKIVAALNAAPPAPHGDAKDAERYRWLRANQAAPFKAHGGWSIYYVEVASNEPSRHETAEAAIDAAIAAQAKGGA